jgi:hypothetical protein
MEDGDPLLEVQVVERFLKWCAASSVGRIKETVNLTSTEVTWQRLQATIYRRTRTQLSRMQNEDILAVARHPLSLR